MNAKEKLAALLKGMQAIVDGAKALGRDLTDEELTALETKNTEATELKATIARQEKGAALIASIGSQEPEAEPTAEKKAADESKSARSLGDHFVKSMKAAGATLQATKFEASEFKAATDTQSTGTRGLSGAFGPLVTDVDSDFVLPKRERLVIADLLSSGTVSGNAITYPVFGALEGGTGTVGEGGQKPQLHVADPTWRTDALGEVAGFFKITDDMAEDLEYVVSEINSTAIYDLQFKEEVQLLNGNGTAPNLRGLLNRSGIQTATQGADSTADAIFKAIGKVQAATDFAADGIVINPLDYEELRLNKDGNGQYFGGGYFQGQYGTGEFINEPPIWGRRTVVTNAIAQGTVLVGAFRPAKAFRKGGLRVESTNSHADDFTNDKITIRVKERLGLQVKYPAAFVKLTLGA